jgi:hypothetical protein
MSLRPHDKDRTPHATPSVIPVAEAAPAASRTHTVAALNPLTNDKRKPAQAAGVAFAYRVRKADAPVPEAAGMPSAFQAAPSLTFQYEERQIGMTAGYARTYENEGGHRVKWSNVASLIIT